MEIRKKRNFGLLLACCLLLLSCSSPKVPDNAKSVNQLPSIYPDYTEVTVPANICPMNFMLTDGSEEAVARLTAADLSYVAGSERKVVVDEGQWQELRDAARGKCISIEVFGRKGEQWTAYKPFNIYVADDEIDEYISYRLIRPSYVVYDELSIAQRNLTNFDESDIYNNKLVMKENGGHCINCHSYRNYNPDSLLFHMRQNYGGTMIACDGKLQKVDLKTDSTLSAGVYPAWHPTIDVIAFSTNLTAQLFYLHGEDKVEVFDSESDLILYDLNKKEVSHISNAPDEMEVFPTWSPDGKTLYYCSAHFEYAEDTVKHDVQILRHLNELHYNLYARSFDPKTRKFGEPRLIYDAASKGKSVTLPRVSPDGKYIAFAQGRQGCFQIWHNDADIMVKRLSPAPQPGSGFGSGSGSEPGLKGQSQSQVQGQGQSQSSESESASGLNTKYAESYPSFSSNGRWLMAASRCDDGNYSRVRIAYFDKNGKLRKGFVLPQQDPEYNIMFNRSFNRPEFMRGPVTVSPREFAAKAMTEAEKVRFIGR